MSKINIQELTSQLVDALSVGSTVKIVLCVPHDINHEDISLDRQQLELININLRLSDSGHELDRYTDAKVLPSDWALSNSDITIVLDCRSKKFKALLLVGDELRHLEIDMKLTHPLNGQSVDIKDALHFVRLLNVSAHDVLLKRFLPAKNRVLAEPDVLNRPWGDVNIYSEHDLSSLRVLSVNKSSRLSFQRHVLRDEYFVALSDGVLLDICYKDIQSDIIDNKKNIITYNLDKGSSMYVKRGTWHRLKSPNESDVEVMEVGYGVYDQVNDIERKEDDYGRKNINGAI